jgi:2,3,4,5-tetrahydropyridine-2-carboxylate N-succinyltransferase
MTEEMRKRIEEIYGRSESTRPPDFEDLFDQFMQGLNSGKIRSAEPSDSGWKVNGWVKKGILLGFRYGTFDDYSPNDSFRYYDKSTYPLRQTRLEEEVRLVPGGTSIRNGCCLSRGVVVMPPAYVNVGAFVGKDSMLDSHSLVGSCAQVGERVHLSAAAQIGGVLEPIGALPVIVEDDVMIGGNCGIYEGTVVKNRAVIGAGTVLTASVPVYDCVKGEVLRASARSSLVIPENAVVVPGSRRFRSSEFAVENDLHLSCAMIVKYRDERTDAATALESALR